MIDSLNNDLSIEIENAHVRTRTDTRHLIHCWCYDRVVLRYVACVCFVCVVSWVGQRSYVAMLFDLRALTVGLVASCFQCVVDVCVCFS